MMNVQKAIRIVQIMIGVNFFWFGMLKFFSGVSPAESLALMTIEKLTFGMIAPEVSIKLLAIWEVLVGIGFLVGRYARFFVPIFMVHMVLTFSPLFLFPELCFSTPPFALTLVGQYIFKNLVFIAAGLVICLSAREKPDLERNLQLHSKTA